MFDKIQKYVLSHPLSKDYCADLLEAVSTVYNFKNFDPQYFDDDLFERTKEKKPLIQDNIIIVAINIVKKLMFKSEFLTKEIQNELELWDKADD